MKKPIDINRGYTMDYLIHGTFSIIAAIIAAVFSYILAVCFLILAICFYMIQTGISIDIENKKLRKFRSLFGKKFGPWIIVEVTDALKLRETDEAQRMNSRGTSTNVHAKTFDLLLSKPGMDEFLIYEFRSYSDALDTVQLIAKEFDLHFDNECKRHKTKR